VNEDPRDSPEILLYDRAPCGFVSTLSDGLIQSVNHTFCVWFGYSRAELVAQKRLQDLLTMGSKIFHQTHWLPLLELQGSVAEVSVDIVHRDGRIIPLLVNATRRQTHGAVHHDFAVFVATDRRKYERELLHERRRAEELLENVRTARAELELVEARLRLALDSAELSVWDIDLESGDARYEAGVQRLLGLPVDAEVSSSDYRARIHPDDRDAEHRALMQATSPGGAGAYLAEYRLLGHDGIERVVVSQGRAFRDDQGRMVRFSGVLQDVTQRRKSEELLRLQERDAQQRAVLAEQLIGIVSHDLRTPLHAINLGASLLGSSSLAPTQTRTVNRISSAVRRAERLIVDLLDFTQARLGGGLRVAPSEIDLHAVVADVVEELKLAWPGRMMEHRREGDGSAFADPARLEQVITNLATNALTYGSPDRAVTITSKTTTRHVVVAVHNFGPGIPNELLPHIFEPLRRGENQVKLGSRSVGLGLYIVQQIAAAHDGRVTVDSSDASGTTFEVQLPVARARPELTETSSTAS
jgi:sigma-B regulation protein RsbU (phosphoserine phosphatase)